MKKKKFKQFDEKKILSRLSNGDMGQILGGKSIDENELSPALDNCIAGCGCGQSACGTTCQA